MLSKITGIIQDFSKKYNSTISYVDCIFTEESISFWIFAINEDGINIIPSDDLVDLAISNLEELRFWKNQNTKINWEHSIIIYNHKEDFYNTYYYSHDEYIKLIGKLSEFNYDNFDEHIIVKDFFITIIDQNIQIEKYSLNVQLNNFYKSFIGLQIQTNEENFFLTTFSDFDLLIFLDTIIRWYYPVLLKEGKFIRKINADICKNSSNQKILNLLIE